MEIKCIECSGEGKFQVADMEESRMVWCECIECNGRGKIEIEIEEEND